MNIQFVGNAVATGTILEAAFLLSLLDLLFLSLEFLDLDLFFVGL